LSQTNARNGWPEVICEKARNGWSQIICEAYEE